QWRRSCASATAAGGLQGLQALSPRHWPPPGAFIKLPALRVVHDFLRPCRGHTYGGGVWDRLVCPVGLMDVPPCPPFRAPSSPGPRLTHPRAFLIATLAGSAS